MVISMMMAKWACLGRKRKVWEEKGKFGKDYSYSYGFNGKENDQETGTQDYGFRIYNPSIARFLSVDPLSPQYPELTPYQFASNTSYSSN